MTTTADNAGGLHVSPALTRAAAPFAIVGVASVIAGGLLAAVIASSPSEHGVWAVAYLVLVSGVAQVGLGLGQALLAARAPTWRVLGVEFGAYNGGNALVVAGTLLSSAWVVDAGGALLVLALASLLWAVRGGNGRAVWVARGYQLLIVILLVSIPIGLLLAHLDNA